LCRSAGHALERRGRRRRCWRRRRLLCHWALGLPCHSGLSARLFGEELVDVKEADGRVPIAGYRRESGTGVGEFPPTGGCSSVASSVPLGIPGGRPRPVRAYPATVLLAATLSCRRFLWAFPGACRGRSGHTRLQVAATLACCRSLRAISRRQAEAGSGFTGYWLLPCLLAAVMSGRRFLWASPGAGRGRTITLTSCRRGPYSLPRSRRSVCSRSVCRLWKRQVPLRRPTWWKLLRPWPRWRRGAVPRRRRHRRASRRVQPVIRPRCPWRRSRRGR